MHDDGIVDPAGRGGYTVLHSPEQLHDIASREDVDSDDELCLRVVADRLDGRLADRITENALTPAGVVGAASQSTHWLAVANSPGARPGRPGPEPDRQVGLAGAAG